MDFKTVTNSERETVILGSEVCKNILREKGKDSPIVFCLEGELGAGKTRFVKGIGEALGINAAQSPTFTIMRKFPLKKIVRDKAGGGKEWFFHVDCYRMNDGEEARQIGLDKIIQNPKSVVAVEWGDRVKKIIPKPYFEIKFEHLSKNKRRITINEIKE